MKAFNQRLKQKLSLIASTIRCLSIDAVEQAGSGHAGTPMGCAEIGAYLYSYYLNYNPLNPQWMNRDRFILSAGHASMLQYSCLHLSGSSLSLEDLKQFRQLNSKTPSHPEYGITEGVESTTGVDGQGIAHGVGQALGLKLVGARFNKDGFPLYSAKVIVLAGDGCLMEGISHEACSFAGHLNLDNLILIYDRNQTCLDGFVSESCSENTKKRYQAYGWQVDEIDGHSFDDIHRVLSRLRKLQQKPALIIANTTIGKEAPTQSGSYFIHSGPLDPHERDKIKTHLDFPDTPFFVPLEVSEFFSNKLAADQAKEAIWDQMVKAWSAAHLELYVEFQKMNNQWLPEDLEQQLIRLDISPIVSGRKASSDVLNFLGDILPGLYGGSADLARSDMTHLHRYAVISSDKLTGKNIKYGVREFGMGGIAIGLAQTKMIRPFIGTFLAFSDYMLNAIRMAALMKLPIIYQLTHDSIFIGQDGPTHQPIEHLSHLRAIPNLQVIRPADANEVKMAWLSALRYCGPTALILSRQETPLCVGTNQPFQEGLGRGAYLLKEGNGKLDFTLIATGSELSLTLHAGMILEKSGYSVRVVSMPSWELFEAQEESYKQSLFGKNSGTKVSIEAASEMGWHKYAEKVIAIRSFGKSARPEDLAQEFGFTVNEIVNKLIKG